MVERLQPGDIVLTATPGKISKVVRRATKGEVSHAMICVQHGSTIDSTDGGVQASNIQRELYCANDTVMCSGCGNRPTSWPFVRSSSSQGRKSAPAIPRSRRRAR
jgi:hypothetical protein